MLSCLLITELSMSTIWSAVDFHFLETTFLLYCSAFFLLAANMRCNVISMLDTKYQSYSHTQPSIPTFWPPDRGPRITTVYNNEMSSLPKPTIVQPSWYPYSRTRIPRSRR